MNRKWFGLSGIVCVLLILGACVSQIVFDEKLPLEESAHLMFKYGAEVTAYNGIPVSYKKIITTTYSEWHSVYLPPGEMEFTLNAYVSWGNVTYYVDNVLFRYKFDAGKHYYIVPVDNGAPDSNIWEWGVRIFESPTPKWDRSKMKFIAYVPFYRHEN